MPETAATHPLTDRGLPLLAVLLAAALLSILASLSLGSLALSPAALLDALLAPDPQDLASRILWELRLPRVMTAFAVGALLGLAGALMQVLLRNPLGDPYVLGVSGGAALAVLAAMLLGLPLLWQAPLAFAGALLSTLLVFALARGGQNLLLTGVVVAAGWGALISFILSISPPMQLPGMLFWLMGDLSGAPAAGLAWGALTLGLLLALPLARELNLLGRGDAVAASLGVTVGRLRWQVYGLASLLTGTAVSIAGSIGFVGLIAPHLVRLAGGRDHRLLLPGAALLGGSLLVLADTLARSLLAPRQLPVGVFTAIIGVPVFLWLLRRAGAGGRR
jgi:iron complex transport system permease protein